MNDGYTCFVFDCLDDFILISKVFYKYFLKAFCIRILQTFCLMSGKCVYEDGGCKDRECAYTDEVCLAIIFGSCCTPLSQCYIHKESMMFLFRYLKKSFK